MKVPEHIAFIMDGNGRWAQARGKNRSAGHQAGYEHIPTVLEICQELGVSYLSGYAWSTKNWGRPSAEVQFIMQALEKQFPRFVDELHKRGVRFVPSGRRTDLLWQSAYACLFVVDNYWPAVTPQDIQDAISYYDQVMVPV